MRKIYSANFRKYGFFVFLLSIFLGLSSAGELFAQSQTLNYTNGTQQTFVVPAGIFSITVETWGGGGSGGNRTSSGAGGGGGGGGYSRSVISVTPGQSISYVVGKGSSAAETSGGDTWFGSNTTLLARGGTSASNTLSTGANGGALGIGNVRYFGGNGANGVTNSYSGGGGSSAGLDANGTNGNNATGGVTLTNGGNGGDGRSSQGVGNTGIAPGGGGGGAYRTFSGTYNGGSGGNGQIVVSYAPAGQCFGSAVAVISNPGNSVSNATNALFAPDGSYATFDANGDQLVLDLINNGNLLNAGGTVGITWAKTSGGTRALAIEASSDNTTWTTISASSAPASTTFQTTNFTLPNATRYIRFTVPSLATGSIYLDAISFLTPCSPPCTNPVINTSPTNNTPICAGANTSFSVTATGTSLTYQWQVSTGGAYSNISNGGVYSNATTSTLNITGATAAMNGYKYQVIVSSGSCNSTSVAATLAVNTVPAQPSIITGTTPVCTGSTQTYSVTSVVGVTYAWNLPAGWSYVSGQNTNSVTYTVGTSGGTVQVTPSNGCGNGTARTLAVSVSAPAAITTDPGDQIKCVGQTATFTVNASGGPLTYQWKKNGSNVGTNSSTYTTPALVAGDNGAQYTVTVTSAGCNSVTSAAATLTVNVPAAISTQPASQSICAGSPVTFSVATTGTPPVSYQWKKGGVDISGETNASYTIAGVSAGDAGSYTVAVTNTCNTIISNAATLVVSTPTSITTDPFSQVKCTGNSVTFSVAASGGPLTYQWRKGGSNIAGATSASYTIPSITVGDAGNYDVVVTATGCNSATSAAASLTVNVTPSITTAPAAQVVCSGNNVTLSVAANGTDLTYQWKKGGVDISGAANSTYTISPVSPGDAGNYSVVVSNSCTSVTSANAALTVNIPPSITTPPADQTICAGQSVTFSVTAGGTNPTFQWRKNGGNIPGANSSTYTRANLTTSEAGSYDVVVSVNNCTSVTSTAATLTISTAPAITTQPASSQIICLGTSATFSVVATGTPAPTYQWKKGGTDIIGATGSSYTIASVSAADAGTYTVFITNTCGNVTSANSVLSTTSVGSWIGVTNNNWFIASNWGCGAIPTSTTDVTIPATAPNMPNINGAGAVCQSITNNGTLTITGANNLDVYGDWINNGTFTAGTGSITFRGGSGNTLAGSSATTFYNLVINKSATANTLTSTSKAFTTTNLTVSQGNLILQATDADYAVSNNISVTSNGILTHNVNWDVEGKKLNVGGNIAIDGVFNYMVRSHVQMSGLAKTVYTGSKPGSAFSILTLVSTGNISAGGTLTINDNFWAMFGSAGSFSTGTNTVTANAALLMNNGTVNINGGTMNVSGGVSVGTGIAATLNLSAGTLNTDGITIGTGAAPNGIFNQSGGIANINGNLLINNTGTTSAYVCTGAPIINITGNWTNNETAANSFVPASSQVNFIGSSAQNINGVATTFYNFKIANSSGLTIGNNVTVSNILDLTNGIITTGVNTLTSSSTSATAIINYSPASYINGKLARAFNSGAGSKIFPIGKGGNYRPLAFTYNTSVASSTITVEQFESPIVGTITPTTLTRDVRYWEITKTGSGSLNYSVTLDPAYTPSPAGSIVQIIKKEGTNSALTATAATSPNYTNGTAFTTFNGGTNGTNQFALGSDCSSSANAGAPLAAICQNGTSASLGGSVSGTATGGTWSTTAGGSFSPDANTLNATWTAPAGFSGTATLVLTPTGGTCPPATAASKTIVVNAPPLINTDPTNQVTCAGTAKTFTVTLSSGTSPTYQWQYSPNGSTGWSNVVNNAPANTTYGGQTTATLTVTPNASAAAGTNFYRCVVSVNSCSSVTSNSATLTVNINSTIALTSGANSDAQTICQNTPLSPITYAIGGGGTGASITVGSLPAGVTGVFNNGVFTISGTPTVAGTFNYTITTSGPCVNPSVSGTITVSAAPSGTLNQSSTSICAGQNVTFTFSNATYGSYIFKLNGVGTPLQTGTSNIYNTSALNNGDFITVDVANSDNCGATFNSAPVTVNALPVATLTPSVATNTICAGDPVTFTAGPAGSGFTYNFKVNGVSQLSGALNTYTTSKLVNGESVTVDVTNASGCVGTSPQITYTVNPLPNGSFTATSSTSVCPNTDVTFQATGAAVGGSYQFRIDGVVVQAWSPSGTFTHNFPENGDGVVTVDVANGPNGTGCTKTYNPGIPVTVNPLPTGSISVTENSGQQNNYEICQGSPVTYTFSNTGYTSYEFFIGGVSKQKASSNIFTTTALAAGDHVSIVVTTGNGCSETFNAPDVTVVAAPAAVLTVSKNTICLNDNATFTSAPFDAAFNYNFKVDGTTVQNGSGTNANTFSTTALPAGNHNVLVEVTNSVGCITTSNTVTITVSPLPTSTLTAVENYGTTNDGEICEGGTVVFTVPAGFSNYNFLLNGNPIQNSASNTYTTSTLNNNDKVTVAITGAGGCIGVLNTIIIKVNPLPAVADIDGPDRVCKSSTITLINTTNSPAGVWSSGNTAVATVNAITGVVTGVAPGSAVISYTYTNATGCSNTVSKTITVNTLPAVAPITGNFNVCTNFSTVLSNATNTGGTWTWSSNNVTIADVDGTGIVTGVADGNTIINYTFTDDITGCSATVSAPIVVNGLPSIADITTTAPAGFNACIGGILQLKNATSGGTWKSLNPGIATISASGLVTGVSAGTVDIVYSIKTSCDQDAADTVTITVNAAPSATINYGGSAYCTNGGQIAVTLTGTTGGTYSIAPTGTATIDPLTGTIAPGATGGIYTVTYTVAAAGGCALYTTTAGVTITTAPSATISYAGPYCTSSAPATVNRTGTAGGTYSSTAGLTIDGTTGTITPASSTAGTYTVTYSVNAPGCAAFTTTASVTITKAPSGTFSYAGSPFCVTSGTRSITNNSLTPGGTFTSAPAGLTINPSTGAITPSTSSGGIYTVTYTVAGAGGCAAYTTTASVTIAASPTAFAGATPLLTCSNSGAINITEGSTATNYSTVVWTSSGTGTFANVNSLTAATYNPSAADIAAGSVTLTLTANASSPCSAAATSKKTLVINAVTPIASVTAAPSTICLGSSSNLFIPTGTSTLMSESFEGTNTFTVVATGANQSAASWTNRTSTYTYNYNCGRSGCSSQARFNSGSKFMLANSDDGGGNTNTALVSPAISTVGYTSLNFTYKTFYQANGSDRGYVEVSTNGGASWTTVQTLSNTTGSQGNFSTQTLILNAYINQASVIIRFRYSANNGYWWALDDVSLTGTAAPNNYSWTATSSATAGLSTDAGIPLQSNANIVVTPTAAGNYTYTATLTNEAGCTSTKDVVVKVNPIPTVSIITDYCAVPNKVQLTATATPGATLSWNTGATTSTILVDVAGSYVVTATFGGCSATATSNVATELVTNGDFSNGNDGSFSSDYAYKPDVAGNSELVDDSGNNGYSITTNGQNVHNNFWGQDHTNNATGPRNFMAVNGHGNTLVVWKQTVNVLPNTTYYFSAWAMSLNNVGPFAQLRFNVDGSNIGTTAVLTGHGQSNGSADNWTRFYGTWTSGPTTTSVPISIVDLQAALTGNDFGIDDISFGTLSTFITLESAPGTDAQTVCKNSAITDIVYNVGNGGINPPTVTGLPDGVLPYFAGDRLTFRGTPTVAGVFGYTITTSSTGTCPPSTATGTITIQEDSIKLTSGSTAPVCKDAPMAPLVYTIGGTAGSATISAGALPAGVTLNDTGNKTFTISGTPTAPAGVYNYTITTSGTCPGTAASVTGTITIQSQTIVLNAGSNNNPAPVCINTTITNINYTVGGTGTGATVTGLPAGVTGSFNSGIFQIKGTPTQAGTFAYIITTTGTCQGVTSTGTITVTPAAAIALTSGPATQTVCTGVAITPIVYTVTDATNASIISGALPAGLTGVYDGTAHTFTISGTSTETVGKVFNYTVGTSGGCASDNKSGSITIQAQTVQLTTGSASQSVCQNAPMTPIVYTISGLATGASLSWQSSSLEPGVTGVYNPGTKTFTISGIPTAAAGVYSFTVTTSGTCGQASATGSITIQALATPGTIAAPLNICSGGGSSLTLIGNNGNIARWESSPTNAAPWTSIPNTTVTLSYTNVTSALYYRAIVANGCGEVPSNSVLVGVHNLWTGMGANNNWNTANNWSDHKVPDASCPNVHIPGGTPQQPLINSGTVTLQNLQIDAGALLTVTGATLQLSGALSNQGNLDVTAATLEFNGTNPQTITTATNIPVKNLLIGNSNDAGVKLAGPLDVYQSLIFSANGKTLDANGNLTIKSTATETAWIGDLTGKTITGNVTVERYINSGTVAGQHAKKWMLLAVPTQGQTIRNSWMEGGNTTIHGYGTQITGAGGTAAGFDLFSAAPSMKYWVQGTAGDWKGIANTTPTQLYNPAGYMIFIRGDRTVSGSPGAALPNVTTLRSTGTLLSQKITVPVIANTFASIGNPYASAIDIRKVMKDKTWPENEFITIWDPNKGGNYGYGEYETYFFDGVNYKSVPGNKINNMIESGQAFIVQTTDNAGAMVFNESAKISGSSNAIFRPGGTTGAKTSQLITNLYGIAADGSKTLVDGTLHQFSEDYNNEIDGSRRKKVMNSGENLAIKAGGKILVVERRQMPGLQDTVFYNLTGVKNQKYALEFVATNLSGNGLEGFVEDTYLKKRTPLNMDGNTAIEYAVNGDAASYVANRFRIVFRPAVVLPVTFVSVNAREKNGDVAVEWKVASESGMQQYEVEKSTDGSRFVKAATVAAANTGAGTYNWLDQQAAPGYNYYRIRSVDLQGKANYSNVVKVLIQQIAPAITIYPNPITNGVINLHLVNQPAGTYHIRLLNPLGQTIVAKQITRADGTTTEQIPWNYNLAHGTYQLQVTKPNGELKVIKVMY